ncbi:MAG TPA: protein kinase [Ktedonobacteraceae bacterium]|nr:protein kinase [Ktedonobacteraceae bacterium]
MALEGIVLGHYRLLRLIGSGGMGEVYLAEDTRIARQVAVKVVRSELDPYPNASVSQDAARLFQREMKAIAALDHPNILPLIDFGEQSINRGMFTYLIMPYRPEGSLVDWLHTRGGSLLSPEEVVPLVLQAAEALQHAHDRQIVHLDVKASNFLVRTREGREPDLLLTDFGIARFSTATSTASQSVRGTPSAMAPEQWAGQPVAASDQYGLAVMTYQLLTGTPPFQGNMQQMMYKHLHEPPQRPSVYNARISPSMDATLLRALAKRPDERFPSVRAFGEALRQRNYFPTEPAVSAALFQGTSEDSIATEYVAPPFQSEQKNNMPAERVTPARFITPPPPAETPMQVPASARPARNRPYVILLLALVVVLVLGGFAIFALFYNRPSNATNGNASGVQSSSNATSPATILPTQVTATAQVPTPSPTVSAAPASNINYGKLLYTTSTVSNQCDKGGGQWADYNQPGLQCAASGTTISNSNSTSPDLVGTILTGIPSGTYPNDYVVEAQIRQADTSSDYGIYFRNQPGNQQGVYTFFIHPNGTWGAYVYDNTTANQTQIASGPTNIDAHAALRITVVIVGSNFTFYINGQRVGTAHDSTYSTGTAGVAVDAGGTILIKNFSLYAVA